MSSTSVDFAMAAAAKQSLLKIAGCSIGFLELLENDVEPLGSGTLVRIGNIAGIVTASHVWNSITTKKLDRVGFYQNAYRKSEIQNTTEDVSFLNEMKIEQKPYDQLGPDVAFVKLSPSKATTLEALGTFLNVEKHRETIAALDATDIYRADAVAGLVAEWEKTVTIHGKAKVVKLEALMNVGSARKIEDGRDGLDRFEFAPEPEPGFDLPSSYGGMSGGGLFRTYLARDYVAHVAFMGVAFWETKVDGKAAKIICHGPKSIYGKLIPKVTKRWRAA